MACNVVSFILDNRDSGGNILNLIIVLFPVLLFLAFLENFLHQRNLKRIRYRILVNGTRGKTTTTSLIAAAMREKGIKTYAKTTGSDARIIKEDGSVENLRRRRGVRLTENIAFVRKAVKAGCECIVVECMALHEENQAMMAEKFIRPTHTIIINTLTDHTDAMGENRESVAWTLSRSVSKDTKLYVTEDFYDSLSVRSFEKVKIDHFECSSPVAIEDEDFSLALALLEDFGISKEEVIAAASSILPDIGLRSAVNLESKAVFIPSFAVNDKENMERKIVSEYEKHRKKLEIIFNNRGDREYRILYIADVLVRQTDKIDKVYIIGEYRGKVARYLRRKCTLPVVVADPEEIRKEMNTSDNIFLGLGNIKGAGEHLIKLCI